MIYLNILLLNWKVLNKKIINPLGSSFSRFSRSIFCTIKRMRQFSYLDPSELALGMRNRFAYRRNFMGACVYKKSIYVPIKRLK